MADIKISNLPQASSVSDTDIVVINQGNITKTATRSLIRGTQNAGTVTSITAGTGLSGGTITGSGTIALSSPVAVANGGTGVGVSSGANSVVLRDANQNITANAYFNSLSSITASAVPVVLTVASAPVIIVTNVSPYVAGQVIKLPDATTLSPGTIFSFNNNQSQGAITVNDGSISSTLVVSVPSGAYTTVVLKTNSNAAGTWDTHDQIPSNASWSTNTLDWNGSITNAAWNGDTVAVNRGGTGAVTLSGLVKGNGTSAFTAAAVGTDYVAPSGNITGTAGNVTGIVAIGNGGTGSTTAALARTALGAAASGANTDITSVALTTGTVSTTPSAATDIANKAYADSIGSGINFHDAADYGTIAVLFPAATYNQPGGAGVGVNATLTGSTNVPLVVDGVTVATGKRILVKNQESAFQNGIYTVTQQGDNATVPYILTRATDYDTSGSGINEVQAGDFVLVLSSTLANTAWVQQTPAPINFGVTAINFTQFAAAAASVTTFSADDTGFTPATATNGTVTLGGTLNVAHGGTGAATLTGLIKGTGTTAMVAAAAADVATTLGSQTAAYVYAAPAALAGTPVFRALVAGDVPTLNQNTTGTAANVTGTVAIAKGGTGATNAANAKINLGVQLKESCKYATVAALLPNTATATTLTGNASGALSVDGVTVSASDRILVKDEVNTANNGIYDVTSVGSVSSVFVLARSTDSNQASEINVDDIVPITLGAQLANTFWLQKSTVTTVGTSPITFVSSTLGGILPITNGGTGATNASTARTNLGITGGTPTDVQVFTATSGTWNKPAGAVYVDVIVIGGGGGGASGRKGGTTNAAGGGGGGAGGSYTARSFQASLLATTETITVGTGGAGGAAVTGTNVNGNAGTAGGNSSFGTWVQVSGGGAAGTATSAGSTAGSAASARAMFQASSGAAGALGAGASALSATVAAGGGGAAGGLPISATVGFAGGNGGTCLSTWFSGGNGTGGAIGLPGTDGQNVTAGSALCSGGGGGGGSAFTGNGGNGGNGGIYGGGGGGGGAALDGVSSSGKGGDGANGIIIVTTYF